jgi:8-oxo-dGTP diphosphatase
MIDQPIRVAVGIIVDSDGNLLLCQRPSHKPYPLQWEFPGGKVEPGESLVEALRRELTEELSIHIVGADQIHEETTTYSTGETYRVAYFLVTSWDGELQYGEFADVTWTSPKQIGSFDVLEGNRTIAAKLERGELP